MASPRCREPSPNYLGELARRTCPKNCAKTLEPTTLAPNFPVCDSPSLTHLLKTIHIRMLPTDFRIVR